MAHPKLGFEMLRLALDMRTVGGNDVAEIVRVHQLQPAVGIAVQLVAFIAKHTLPRCRIDDAVFA